MCKPIAILTDFGTRDPFVGIMKGVIATINTDSQIIDITHEIPPGDIRLGAITLWQAVQYFPKTTVFLVVIDPVVGSSRRPIILETGDATFIGPDNGVLSYVISEPINAWELTNPEYALPIPRKTFHGRDIFAPGAAHLSAGIPPNKFGESIKDLKKLPFPILNLNNPRFIRGEILHIDRFGNALTSIGVFHRIKQDKFILVPWVQETPSKGSAVDISGSENKIEISKAQINLVDGTQIGWVETFTDILDNKCAFIIGSSGLIEIAANRQSASKLLNLKSGDLISLQV